MFRFLSNLSATRMGTRTDEGRLVSDGVDVDMTAVAVNTEAVQLIGVGGEFRGTAVAKDDGPESPPPALTTPAAALRFLRHRPWQLFALTVVAVVTADIAVLVLSKVATASIAQLDVYLQSDRVGYHTPMRFEATAMLHTFLHSAAVNADQTLCHLVAASTADDGSTERLLLTDVSLLSNVPVASAATVAAAKVRAPFGGGGRTEPEDVVELAFSNTDVGAVRAVVAEPDKYTPEALCQADVTLYLFNLVPLTAVVYVSWGADAGVSVSMIKPVTAFTHHEGDAALATDAADLHDLGQSIMRAPAPVASAPADAENRSCVADRLSRFRRPPAPFAHHRGHHPSPHGLIHRLVLGARARCHQPVIIRRGRGGVYERGQHALGAVLYQRARLGASRRLGDGGRGGRHVDRGRPALRRRAASESKHHHCNVLHRGVSERRGCAR